METQDMQGWFQLFGQLGVVVILMWYLYHTTTKTIPGITEATTKKFDEISTNHQASIEKVCDGHNASLEHVCERFERCLADERKARTEEQRDLRAWLTNKPTA